MEPRLRNYLSAKLDRLQKLAQIVEANPTRVRVIKVIKESDNWILALIEFAVEGGLRYCEEGIIFKNSIEGPSWILRRWIRNIQRELTEEVHHENKENVDITI